MPEKKPLSIYAALAACNRDIDAIGKGQRNKQQGFQFRGIDDAYNELHKIFAKHGVITTPKVLDKEYGERTTKSGGALFVTKLTVAYEFIAEDGSSITVGPVIGEAMDSGDKGCNKALAVAHKYALFQTFTIPTEFVDPDTETHTVKAKEPLATEEQKKDIAALWDYVNQRNKVWVRNNKDTMTEKQASDVIYQAEKSYAADASGKPEPEGASMSEAKRREGK